MKKIFLSALFLLLFNSPASGNVADERDPVSIIKEASSHILETLDSRRAEFTENPELLRNVVRDDLLPLIDSGPVRQRGLSRATKCIFRCHEQCFN